MTPPATTRPCPACGTPGSGSFCSTCGASLGTRTCRACQAELSAQARFCHRCGAAAPAGGPAPAGVVPGARSEKTAWTIAGLLVLALFAMIAYKVVSGPGAARAPDMANAGNARPGGAGAPGLDPGGPLGTGPAPDISALSPAQRFIRLNNRIMEAAGRGDSATVINFTPMALGAYAQLDTIGNDERYHAAVLNAQVGRIAEALALTDTMLAITPGYLLAYVVRGDIARYQDDGARLRRAYADFNAAYPAESAAARPEYADHQNVLDEFRGRSTAR